MRNKSASWPRVRFSIKSLAVLLTLACSGLAVWVSLIRPTQQQAAAMAWVRKHQGEYQTTWKGPEWLDRPGLRFPAFNRIVAIKIRGGTPTDEDLQLLAPLKELHSLSITGAPITDAALPYLQRLKNLDDLILSDTKLSVAAIEDLGEAMPNLRLASVGNVDRVAPLEKVAPDKFVQQDWLELSSQPNKPSRMTVRSNTVFEVANWCEIGDEGTAILHVEKDATFRVNNWLEIAGGKPAANCLLSADASKIAIASHTTVGQDGGSAKLELKNGARMTVGDWLEVGQDGFGIVLVSEGSTLHVKNWGELAEGTTSFGELRIEGENSAATIGGHFTICSGGQLILRDGGKCMVGEWMEIDPKANIEIELLTNDSYDAALVANRVGLKGTLHLTLGSELPSNKSSEFVLIKGRIHGQFDTVEFPQTKAVWRMKYGADQVSVVAEPKSK